MSKIIPISVFFIAISCFASAQFVITADSIFTNARNAAFEEKDYDKATLLAHQALFIKPKYNEIEVFLGRLFTWRKKYDSARYFFKKVLVVSPDYEDAGIAFTDLEYWNDHYNEALKICDESLALKPTSELLLIRKAKILIALKKYKDARIVTSQLLNKNKNNTAAIALMSSIKDVNAKNKISLDYNNSSFDKQFDKPWHLVSIAYTRQSTIGSIIGRLNYANRFGSNGLQAEVDAYPRISKTFYSYINFGYSNNVGVFPKYRAGISLYVNLPKSFEAEAGIRYLYFTGATSIYTFYIGKYYKNFLFSARSYITPSNGSFSQSYSLAARYYLKTAEDYFGLSLGTGISPDDTNQNIQLNTKQSKLTTSQISANFNHIFLKLNTVSIRAGLIKQEYQPKVKGNQFNVSAGLSHRF